jgi:hypothetical protein
LVSGLLAALIVAGVTLVSTGAPAAHADGPPQIDLKVLLIGLSNSDPVTLAWESQFAAEGVPYTLVLPQGSSLTLPNLVDPDNADHGLYDGVVLIPSTYQFSWGTLAPVWNYEAEFGIRQLDGYVYPAPALQGIGYDSSASTNLGSTTATVTNAGLTTFPALAGTVPLDATTFGYPSTVQPSGGDSVTSLLQDASGDTLIAVDQHPSPDYTTGQSGVSEMSITFDYNSLFTSWLVLAPSLIDWVTDGMHLGLSRNYVEMDIDDTFTADDAWSIATHSNDYTDADSLRMSAADVVNAAQWSQVNDFRMDQLFNGGGSVAYQNGESYLAPPGPDPVLAQFQATDPTTGEPYADDFGWISHTYDTPYLDVGCATENYIEAELNENTNWAAAPAGASAGTGGLGLTESTNTSDALGTENPQVFVPGNHSGLPDLVPGTPATVDPPDLDAENVNANGGSLAAGSYQYAVTDQFNASDSPSTDQSQAYVTAALTVPAGGSVSLVWQAICHAADYLIYREVAGSNQWSMIGTDDTPPSATLPDNSSGDPVSTSDVTGGGEKELTFTDTGSSGTAEPSGWTPPTTENANELPWEQNPYFTPALEAVGITAVGGDASKPYPNPADVQFGIGTSYSGAKYGAGTSFPDGSAQVVPRHPINIFYNVSTEAQEVDEYNTLYLPPSLGGTCVNTSTTTCLAAPATFADIINSIVAGMMGTMLSNNPEPTYVHQTNIMGTPPPGPATSGTPPNTSDTTGDGLLYSVLNPLLAEYHQYFSALAPYEQLTEGASGTVLAEQSAWASALSAGTVTSSAQNGVVTVTNNGSAALEVPMSMPVGSSVNAVAVGPQYGATSSGWVDIQPGASATVATVGSAPAFTGGSSATAQTGDPLAVTIAASGTPYPALSESGALPGGITFTDNGNGTASLSGTPDAGTGGVYALSLTADNEIGSPATQDFTLTVDQPSSFTSNPSATAAVGSPFSATVSASGFPTPALTESGPLPAGVTFTDNGSGTATLGGTPGPGSNGSFPLTLTAANGVGPSATQDFTLTVDEGAGFTGADSATFTVGQAGDATVTTAGFSQPTLSESGSLPSGVTFTDNSDGTATVAGTPGPGTGGVYPLTLTAAQTGDSSVTESYTLTVDQAPAITSVASATFATGAAGAFTVDASGFPAPALTESGPLPAGVTFTDNGNGTASLSGTPAAGTGGTYPLVLTADNAVDSPQTQDFTLTVNQAPAVTSAATASFELNQHGSFTVAVSGFPTPTLGERGTVPRGLSFTNNLNGTATIAGTPTRSGRYPLVLHATNTAGSATQTLQITVDQAPTVSVRSAKTAKVGHRLHITVRSTGYPKPALTESGTLPSGVTFVDGGNGTGRLSGTPAAGSEGSYTLVFTATNGSGHESSQLVLTVVRH